MRRSFADVVETLDLDPQEAAPPVTEMTLTQDLELLIEADFLNGAPPQPPRPLTPTVLESDSDADSVLAQPSEQGNSPQAAPANFRCPVLCLGGFRGIVDSNPMGRTGTL